MTGLSGVEEASHPASLIVVADDFGLHPSYDSGIIQAADAGAIDAVGVMVLRTPQRIGELLASGVAIGLHAEGRGADQTLDERDLRDQLAELERLIGRRADYLDGHHHCHAHRGAAAFVPFMAARLGLPVRSIDPEQRDLLRRAGVRTPDLLVGRYAEDQPVLPAALRDPPPGIATIEWMVHPGHPDPGSGSAYDRGRGEDLEAVLSLELPPTLRRGSHGVLARLGTR